MQTLKYVCKVGTLPSIYRTLPVPECCSIKLACTVADNLASSLSPGWIVLQVSESREGTSSLLCRQLAHLHSGHFA